MKSKIFIIFAILLIACSTLQFVEPAAANTNKACLIDHGTKYFKSESYNSAKVSWKTYWISKNTRKVIKSYYHKNKNGKWIFDYKVANTLRKVSKTKLKSLILWLNPDGSVEAGDIEYFNTRLDTRGFYWKKYRPHIEREYFYNH